MAYRAMYIWSDGTEPTPLLRSKTNVLKDGEEPGIWGFDGSSTNQAPGGDSDVVLRPVKSVPDPIRGGDDILVLSECLTPDFEPHPTNTRAACVEAYAKYADFNPIFGLEQEYTFITMMDPTASQFYGPPPGFPLGGYPAPQGPYYCSVGANRAFGRVVVDKHSQACIDAGLAIEGTNAEVMPGQWEYQIGPLPPVEVSDQILIARWLIERIGEDHGLQVTLHPKPVTGDWNGAGCHTNVSTRQMMESYDAVIAACEALGANAEHHIKNYGADSEMRLTGAHETQRYDQFSYAVSDRGASVRIPWTTHKNQKGYIEDRRPNSNCDPYLVTRLIMETICGAASS